MKLTHLFQEFVGSEKAGGLLLIGGTLISLIIANSPLREAYHAMWHHPLAGESVVHWINDGLMTVFFLLIGLELEREIYQGELSNFKNATLPIFGALGGMLVPAGLYYVICRGSEASSGVGIPMATDIAFALSALTVLGSRVPASLKVFLTALAVIDDLGAIIVIALFYTQQLNLLDLGLSLGLFGIMLALNRFKVHLLWPYLILGAGMWYFMLHSGVHATLSGVLLAFAIPFGDGGEQSPSYGLQHRLHYPVAFFVLPIFAMANTAISFEPGWHLQVLSVGSLGVILGLSIGKPLGIASFTFLAAKMGWCKLPADLEWNDLTAVGFLGGIGFTMSIFISLLAFEDPTLINTAKMAILIGSVASAVLGIVFLRRQLRKRAFSEDELPNPI